MTVQNPTQATSSSGSGRFLPLLLLLFVGSGCSALIYEIVWFQLLQLVIGSSAVSLGVLLGTFMGGMCLGSLALPRMISARRHPLRVYALLELGTGIIGIAVLFVIPFVDRFYAASAGHGLPGILLRGAVCAACLLPPTLLMGATLPAIARWVETTPEGVSWLGLFYGGNIAGAVCGCLAAGFYLLRVYDVATATYVAAGINGTVAMIGLIFAAVTPHRAPDEKNRPASAANARGLWPVYITIALSGMSALGAEVIWTRILSLMLGATVYTFSIILAVFLVGLGIGSGIGAFVSRGRVRPWIALGCCQILLAAAIGWTAFILADSLPFWPIDPWLSTSPWLNFQLDLVRCAWAIFPATCLWGASFPLAIAAVSSPGKDPGRLVGNVYAANTVGAILGAVGFSIILIAWIGTQQSQRVLMGLSVAAGLWMLVPLLRPFRARITSGDAAGKPGLGTAGTVVMAAVIGLAALLAWKLPVVPWVLVAYGRVVPSSIGQAKMLYVGEGMNSSVAVSEKSNGVRNFHVSGKIEASSEPQDMRLERMLGHIPALLHSGPRSVLVVGCGAGITAGTFVLYPEVERIVICEIEPLIPPIAADYFGPENYNVLDDPRVEVVYDDARHYILTTKETFDLITSDPIHPWVKGSATLYSKEYFEMCRRHLNPGGVITQWVPLYESDEGVVKCEIKTFFDVFPDGTIWGNDINGGGYDVVLFGQNGATKIDVDQIQRRMDRDKRVMGSLAEVGFFSALELLATYSGQASDLQPWLADAEINRDWNLRLQYLAGMGLNLDRGKQIFALMLTYYKFPKDLFAGSDLRKAALKFMIQQRNQSAMLRTVE
jgi:spermidine synthase